MEFENVICVVDHADVLAPRAFERDLGIVLWQVDRVTKRLLGLELSYLPRLESIRLARGYELLCVYALALGDLTVLCALPGWRARFAKAVCFVEETWTRGLARSGERTFDELAKFDLITCVQHGTASPLGALVGRPCNGCPVGSTPCASFRGGIRPRERSTCLRWAGTTHAALLEHAMRHGWTYLFDTLEARHVLGGDHVQHRAQLAELVKRSRNFVANRSRVDRIEDTGEQEEVGYRSFEARRVAPF